MRCFCDDRKVLIAGRAWDVRTDSGGVCSCDYLEL